MARHATDTGLSEHDRNVLERREDHGWFVMKIAEDDRGPGFAYTFGLYEEFKHPELVLYGLDPGHMHRLLNDAGKRIKAGTRYYQDGDVIHDLLEGYRCAFRSVNPRWYSKTCTWALWFYQQRSFPVLQLVWPDKNSRFPWDTGFDDSLRSKQPDLSQPPPSA
jgi:uncharacterized protein DUF4262